jgi:hypothetical protein
MFLLRGLFWLGLIAYLAPYKMIDGAHASFIVDEKALAERFAALPHYCDHHHRVCGAAQDLAAALGAQAHAAVSEALRLKASVQ